MGSDDGFAFRSSYGAQRQMAELALTLLRLRADTPPGRWVDEHHGAGYQAVLEQARAMAGSHAQEDLLLSVLTLADVLLRSLVAATGIEDDEWLARVHRHCIAPIDPDGSGVWGPEQLAV